MIYEEDPVTKLVEQGKHHGKQLDEIKILLSTVYVTQSEFQPVKTLTYGFVGIMLVGLLGALFKGVLK